MADCCGDAHFELEAALDHISALGFEREWKESADFVEELWHNRLAERLQARVEALERALEHLIKAQTDSYVPGELEECICGKCKAIREAIRAARKLLGEKGSTE